MADLVTRKLQICIIYLLKRIQPAELKNKMLKIIAWEKDIDFGKKDLRELVRKLGEEARKKQEPQLLNLMPKINTSSLVGEGYIERESEASGPEKATFKQRKRINHRNERGYFKNR